MAEHGDVDRDQVRRGDLVYMVLVAEYLRMGRRPQRQWAAQLLPGLCARAGCRWAGAIDRAWITRELAKVRARPGDYTEESYERWRLRGVPVWAALAAGMTPTPGSLKLAGRRPRLP
jgi:hypothetical protein